MEQVVESHDEDKQQEQVSLATRKKFKFPKRAKRDPDPTVPYSAKEALADSNPERDGWKQGMDAEYNGHVNVHHTWDVVSVKEPERDGSQIIGCKWVFRKKWIDAKDFAYKCRLTVKGFMQRAGVDYDDVFSSVAQLKSFRLVVALSAIYGFSLTHYDFEMAFCQAVLPKPVYMHHPDGYPGPPGTCLRLRKSLYGLKAAPKMWSELLRSFLITLGFVACVADQCIMIHVTYLMWLVTFSDDVIIATNNEPARRKVVDALAKRFKIKQLGRLSKYVGIQVSYGGGGSISLSQDDYVGGVLNRYGMEDAKPANTPAALGASLHVPTSQQDDLKQEESDLYRPAVGSLWYASRGTRPDVEYATNTVAQYSNNHGSIHWQAVKRIFRYLKGCVSTSITYFRTAKVTIIAYSDSDWGSETLKIRLCGVRCRWCDSVANQSAKDCGFIIL